MSNPAFLEDEGNHPAATANMPLALRPATTTMTTDLSPEIHKLWADALAAAYSYILSPDWGTAAIETPPTKQKLTQEKGEINE